MNILLLGANGRTGRRVLRRALGDRNQVTALVRSEDRLTDVRHERLRIAVGNACDTDVLAALLPGHDVVISTLGPRRPTKSACVVYPASARALVASMEQSGTRRLLVTSSAMLFEQQSLFGRALQHLVPHIVAGASTMEDHIRSSGLDWTIARTGFLSNDKDASYQVAKEVGGTVSRAGVARFLLTAAEQSSFRRQVVGLRG